MGSGGLALWVLHVKKSIEFTITITIIRSQSNQIDYTRVPLKALFYLAGKVLFEENRPKWRGVI